MSTAWPFPHPIPTPKTLTCISCHKPFVFGPKGDPDVNVYSLDGKREVRISGMCELCFDEVTKDPDDE